MPPSRRDILLFRVAPTGGRTADLSCRQLYLRTVDAQCGVSGEEAAAHQPWMGEPPAVFARPADQSPLREIEDTLKEIDVLRVLEGEWLTSTPLGAEVEPILAAFRARGGRVEYAGDHEPLPPLGDFSRIGFR